MLIITIPIYINQNTYTKSLHIMLRVFSIVLLKVGLGTQKTIELINTPLPDVTMGSRALAYQKNVVLYGPL